MRRQELELAYIHFPPGNSLQHLQDEEFYIPGKDRQGPGQEYHHLTQVAQLSVFIPLTK